MFTKEIIIPFELLKKNINYIYLYFAILYPFFLTFSLFHKNVASIFGPSSIKSIFPEITLFKFHLNFSRFWCRKDYALRNYWLMVKICKNIHQQTTKKKQNKQHCHYFNYPINGIATSPPPSSINFPKCG